MRSWESRHPPDLRGTALACDKQRATSLLSFRRGITPSKAKKRGGRKGTPGTRWVPRTAPPWWGQSPVSSPGIVATPPGSRRRQGHPKTLVEANKSLAGVAGGLGFAGGLWLRRGIPAGTGTESKTAPRKEGTPSPGESASRICQSPGAFGRRGPLSTSAFDVTGTEVLN